MTKPESHDEAVPVLDLLGDVDTREHRRTEVSDVEIAPRRWPIAVAAAATALLIAATVFAPGQGQDDSATPTSVTPAPRPAIAPAPSTPAAPSPIPGLYPDLPLEGATPSSPQTGELVASVARIHNSAWYVYADGRLISTGDDGRWIERRLTPEGVERVRSEFLSTGLFDPDQPTGSYPPSDPPPFCICARDGGRLLSARRPAMAWPSRLIYYLGRLDSSLPQDLWADREIKGYVPSKYALCVSRMSTQSSQQAVPYHQALALIPARAAERIGNRLPTRGSEATGDATCFELTTEEARALADEFDPSGWRFEVTEPVSMTISVGLWALLPHGSPAAFSG